MNNQRPITLKGDAKTRQVSLNGKPLDLKYSLRVRNHSPDGFAWGYAGSGPSQLSLAICLELYGLADALQKYHDFKWKYIVDLPSGKDFEITYYIDKK